MRISTGKVDNETVLLLQEIYCNTVLETAEGNRVAICMRDDTIEFNIIKLNKWCRINMSTGDISLMDKESAKLEEKLEAKLGASMEKDSTPNTLCPHYFEATDGVHVVVVGRCDCKGKL